MACSGEVFDAITDGGFVHGFTHSHSVVGAAVGRAVLAKLKAGSLVEASREKGERLSKELSAALADDPHVGDIRGLGLMIGVELVEDRDSKRPLPRTARAAERVIARAKESGLILYPSTGCADGTNGDLIMLGPPFGITEGELGEAVDKTREAIGSLRSS
jgi:adenosylmethionine-8-amino-7-oxononanoate aminotransferase